MSRPVGTIHGRFDSIGVGTTVTPGNGGGGGQIEEPFPPGVYASEADTTSGLSRLSSELFGLINPVSFTFSIWFKFVTAGSQTFFRTNEVGEGILNTTVVGHSSGALTINIKDSASVTRFTYSKAGVFSTGWNHLLLSVKIDETTEVAGTHIWANNVDHTGTGTSTWSAGSNMGWGLANYLFWIFNEKAGNNSLSVSDDCLGPFWLDINRFTDFSVEATRRKFISAVGRPVGLGIYGETPFGLRPTIYIDNPFTELNVNRGTGNDFQYVDRDTDVYDVNTWTACADNPATGALAF